MNAVIGNIGHELKIWYTTLMSVGLWILIINICFPVEAHNETFNECGTFFAHSLSVPIRILKKSK